jgi:hypothetical protein
MRKSVRKTLVVAAVVASGVGLTAVPAYAGPPWTVSGAPATGEILGTSTDSQLQLVRNGVVVNTLTCDQSDIPVQNIANGSNNGSTPIGTIPAADTVWTTCRESTLGLSFTVTGVGTWNLFVVADGPPGNVKGEVRDVEARISGLGCTATFKTVSGGGVPGHYTNSTHVLTLDPTDGTNTLQVTAASCGTAIQMGDEGRFIANYDTDPATVEITG